MSEISEVATGVFRIVEQSDGRLLCMYLLWGNERSLLVDAGLASTPARTLVPAFEHVGFDPADLDYVLITHADVDHCGGLGAVRRLAPASRTICGTGDRELIENVELMIERRYREFRDSYGIDQDPEFLAWVRAEADMGSIDLELVSVGVRLSADWTVRVVPTPGHSHGHLAVVDDRTRTAVIGDAVLGSATPLASGDAAFAPTYRHVDAYRATVSSLRAMNLRQVLTAHDRVLEGSAVVGFWDESEQFCRTLERVLIEQLRHAGPMTTGALIYAAAGRVRTWPEEADATLAYPVVGHLESLRARGVVHLLAGTPARWITRT